ncbi:MAG: hypothetical protein IJ600_03380 [Lachnospiraceae bacterium]|nr:hypothetical protein [Lachnospiraceae bacterium]
MGNKGVGLLEVLLIAVLIAMTVTGLLTGHYLVAGLAIAILGLFFIASTI